MDVLTSQPPVTAGVDGSDESLRAVRWAAREAARRAAPLRLVTAFGWADRRAAIGHRRDRAWWALLRRGADGLVATAADIARAEAPDVAIEQIAVAGRAADVLRADSRTAGLLVIGGSGAGRLGGLVAGSVAVGVATGAHCPVVVVRGADCLARAEMGLPVVLGVDGSAGGEVATAFAFEAAAARSVPLIAVHAWWDPVAGPALARFLDLDAIEADERDRLAHRLAGWIEKHPSVAVGRAVLRDRPAHALLQHAAQAQLLVVGSRGRSELAGAVLGSVSNAVVHRAPCPVAVIRPHTPRPVR
jgi:nucleotide-binding universal stress UspA family protein